MNEQVLDLSPLRIKGQPSKRLEVEVVRELGPNDVATLGESRGSKPSPVKRFRDSHHRVARCFASGMKPGEVNLQTGYSLSRLSILQGDPAFQDLIAVYREAGTEEYAEYQDLALANMVRAERLIEESLEAVADREQPLALGELRPLTELISDRADRFGFPKKTVTANLNLDFAGRLETARKRASLEALPFTAPNGTQGPGHNRKGEVLTDISIAHSNALGGEAETSPKPNSHLPSARVGLDPLLIRGPSRDEP